MMLKNTRLLQVLLSFILLLTFLGGCAGVQKKRKSPEQLYSEGMKSLEGRRSLFFFHVTDYEKAQGAFEEIKNRYSYTTYAPLAELRLADIHFRREEYAEAIIAYSDFLRLHPDHQEVPYSLYRLALSYFNQIKGLDRDQTPVREALVHLQTLVDKFPPSAYPEDVPGKIEYCKDMLSRNEYYVGIYYFKKKNYEAAIARFKLSLEKFPGMGPKEDALLYLGKSYLASDRKEKGLEALERLLKAFPASEQAREAKSLLALQRKPL